MPGIKHVDLPEGVVSRALEETITQGMLAEAKVRKSLYRYRQQNMNRVGSWEDMHRNRHVLSCLFTASEGHLVHQRSFQADVQAHFAKHGIIACPIKSCYDLRLMMSHARDAAKARRTLSPKLQELSGLIRLVHVGSVPCDVDHDSDEVIETPIKRPRVPVVDLLNGDDDDRSAVVLADETPEKCECALDDLLVGLFPEPVAEVVVPVVASAEVVVPVVASAVVSPTEIQDLVDGGATAAPMPAAYKKAFPKKAKRAARSKEDQAEVKRLYSRVYHATKAAKVGEGHSLEEAKKVAGAAAREAVAKRSATTTTTITTITNHHHYHHYRHCHCHHYHCHHYHCTITTATTPLPLPPIQLPPHHHCHHCCPHYHRHH